jgi:hypothetical protein
MHARFAGCSLLVLLILLRADLLACSCRFAGPFFTVRANAALIVRATVVRYVAHGMDVEVHETFKGAPDARTIRIWGDTGIQCRPYVTAFPVGTEWVFAVGPSVHDTEVGYVISACGEYAVRVEKDVVSGRLTSDDVKAPQAMDLVEFRRRFNTSQP